MRFKGIHLSVALLSLGLVALTGCGGGDNDSARFAQTVDASKNTITQIALTEDTTTVHVQGSHQFKVNGLDAENKVIADLTSKASWTLSDRFIQRQRHQGRHGRSQTHRVLRGHYR
jgi:hypothetical protein